MTSEHDITDLARLTDEQLAVLAGRLSDETRRRARERGDVDQIVEDAFRRMFDSSGAAREPVVADGLLLCPGSLIGAPGPTGSHECVFVSAAYDGEDGSWVFEHPDIIIDTVRHTTVRTRPVQQSITVLPAVEGMKATRVASRARSGRHERRQSETWQVTGGSLTVSQPPAGRQRTAPPEGR